MVIFLLKLLEVLKVGKKVSFKAMSGSRSLLDFDESDEEEDSD